MREFVFIARAYFGETNFFRNLGKNGRRFAVVGWALWLVIVYIGYRWVHLQQYSFVALVLTVAVEIPAIFSFMIAVEIGKRHFARRIQVRLKRTIPHGDYHLARKYLLEELLLGVDEKLEDAIDRIEKVRVAYAKSALPGPDRVGEIAKGFLYERDARPRILALVIVSLSLAGAALVSHLADADVVWDVITDKIDYVHSAGVVLLVTLYIVSICLTLYMGASFFLIALAMHLGTESVLVRFLVSQASYYSYLQKDSGRSKLEQPIGWFGLWVDSMLDQVYIPDLDGFSEAESG